MRPADPRSCGSKTVTLPAPGRGEVLVRNHAIGLNFIDVYFRTGSYEAAPPFRDLRNTFRRGNCAPTCLRK